MKLHNSLTKQKDEFVPIEAGKVRMYSCGPTVYNKLHIGNLSAFIYADLLRRTLSACGYEVKHVMNITDVDDKTIRDSLAAYPDDEPKVALKRLTDTYTEIFMNDLRASGNDTDSISFVSAVSSIDSMISLIQRIIDAGHAYVTDDGVYFAIDAYVASGHTYGVLQHIERGNSKSRINNDEYEKDTAADFALWKALSPGEPSWNATFVVDGKEILVPGRPGWHIECSAMSEDTLGTPFDIHTGGIDLKFPHHENEIAQTCSASSGKLANYFVHNNHILVDGRKMSKSLNNFYTLEDIEARGYTALDFRMLVLEGHYSKEKNFTWDILEAAHRRLKYYYDTADLKFQTACVTRIVQEKFQTYEGMTGGLLRELGDDLDTPSALTFLNMYFDHINSSGYNPENFQDFLEFIDSVLGLGLSAREDITDEQKSLMSQRAVSRHSKDWQESDRLRELLKEQGLSINDTPDGTQIWSRI